MKGYIYHIINKIDGKRYIGQTIDIERRRKTHLNRLRKNKHPNIQLQQAWNEWGEESFMFIYEEYEYEKEGFLNNKEIEQIQLYNSFVNGYNRTAGGQGGIARRSLTYEQYCFIYYGCQWQGMTEKIAHYLGIDSSTVSSVLRKKAHLDYLQKSQELSEKDIEKIKQQFKEVFNIPYDKTPDNNRTPSHVSENDYYYCFCITSTYGRGIDAALARYFDKHKTFLTNGFKCGKQGVIHRAYQRFLQLSPEEIEKIGEEKFQEWHIQNYSKRKIEKSLNNRWRQ